MVIIIRLPQPEITKMRGLATELVQKKEVYIFAHNTSRLYDAPYCWIIHTLYVNILFSVSL